ncbi:nitroreductase [Oceanobacillus chungangensis]|uniref:Nitroreductase n=2 Tax=Oceanobacillus chungangensis TaxID=1229152 RepID=A0A3D8PPC8_9BACI|nr:nitroreductase [Oceanobacillus chungangensis]
MRRSTHTFKNKPVDIKILTEIFTYGSYAPTHYMKEPWNIKLYQGKGRKEFVDAIIASYVRIGMIKNDDDPKSLKLIDSMSNFLLSVPHHALIYMEKEADTIRYEEDYAAVCAFIQNTQLAGWEYGVGMLWTITPYMNDPLFLKDIGLDSEVFKIAAVLQIGYPDKVSLVNRRTPIEKKMELIE